MLDCIISGGDVIDGTGAPRIQHDVGIRGDRIAAVGNLSSAKSLHRVDVTGKIVAPGFIDVHNHSDGWLLKRNHLEVKTRQGFTTEILMADGISYAPVSPETARQWMFYLRSLNALRMDEYRDWLSLEDYMMQLDGNNVQNSAMHVPYANVRSMVCGFGARRVDDFQRNVIHREIQIGMEAGAVGLSTGLDYIVQCFSDTAEIVAACRVMRGLKAPYVTHIRYKLGLLAGLEEAFEIGRRADVPVHISHLKALPGIGAERVFEVVDKAARDVDVTFDVYPYQPGSTMLSYLLPYEVWEEGPLAAIKALGRPETRERIQLALLTYRLDLDNIRIAWVGSKENSKWIGCTVGEYVKETGKSIADAVCDLLIDERLAVLCVMNDGDDQFVRPFLAHDRYMMGSDGIYFPDGQVHPRVSGSATRLLGSCVRQHKLFSLETAVQKMSSFPAQRFGLVGRGRIAEGEFADIVVFDAENVGDGATYEDPHHLGTGMEHVWVNGQPIIEAGTAVTDFGDRLPGRFLRSRQES